MHNSKCVGPFHSFLIHYHTLFIAVLANIDSDIENVTVTKEEMANFTCQFLKGNSDDITVYWTVDDRNVCVNGEEEEDIGPDNNGCYTTETQSVLIIRNTSSFTSGSRYTVQCNLQQNIPEEFLKNNPMNSNRMTRKATLGKLNYIVHGCIIMS